MINDLVCKGCGGSRVVAYKREHRPIGDTGLERECKIPDSQKDIDLLQKVYPKSPPIGYRLAYEWGTVMRNEKEIACVYVGMEKIESDTPEASGDKELRAKNKDQLVEMAVLAGLTDADASWSKAKLIAEILKSQTGSKAEVAG